MATIVWTHEAKQNLQAIFDYISVDNPTAAYNVTHDIYRKVQLLHTFPQLGWKYEFVDDRELRILLYGHYRIVYQIHSERQISILGVFHSAMDIEEYFQ